MSLSETHPLVQEWGGKHGALLALCDAGLGDHIVPAEYLKGTDSLTRDIRTHLQRLCDEFDTDEVIVRTSHPGDYRGLTDAMPTAFASLEDLPSTLDTVRQRLLHPKLLKFAANEGAASFPEAVTFSIAPSLRRQSPIQEGTITEHPNEQGRVYVDYTGSTHGMRLNFAYKDGYGEETCPWESYPDAMTDLGYSLYARLRESGTLDESEAMQLEYGIDKQARGYLYQVRRFARYDLSEDRSVSGKEGRFFGNINPNRFAEDDSAAPGLPPLTVVRTRHTEGFRPSLSAPIWEDFARHNPEQPFLLVRQDLQDKFPLTLEDQPRNMFAYVGRTPGLNHGHTRLIQYALNRGGGAWLAPNSHAMRPIFDHIGKKVLVYSVCPTNFGWISGED